MSPRRKKTFPIIVSQTSFSISPFVNESLNSRFASLRFLRVAVKSESSISSIHREKQISVLSSTQFTPPQRETQYFSVGNFQISLQSLLRSKRYFAMLAEKFENSTLIPTIQSIHVEVGSGRNLI